jgi:hypothetical protein
MNRLSTLILIGLAGLLASCGSSVSSSTKPGLNDVYSMVVSPTQFTLNAGDWSSITATVDLSYLNETPKPIAPQPTIKFYSSDARVTVSPAGEVCAGQWNTEYQVCTPTATLPTGYVTITAYDASRNVTGSTLVSIHPRAAGITLNASATSLNKSLWPGSAQPWPSNTTGLLNCVSQNNQVQYVANPVDANSNGIGSCSVLPQAAGCIYANDYTWTVTDTNVATVSDFGYVVARNPGVTNVYATLNGTRSAPLAFVTCPPSSIVLTSSAVTGSGLPPVSSSYPYTTGDLTLIKGDQEYLTATMLDTNNNPLITSPLNYITSNPLTGSFSTTLQLTSTLTANTAGRFSVIVSCEPGNCNNSVADFVSPAGPSTGKAIGFGYPIYSNVIGATVQGFTGSTVLVTGTTLTNGTTPAHILLAYDSEALTVTQTVGLANTPNSMVVAPNGAKAYLGSSAGLMVLDLASYQSTIQNFSIVGGLSTDEITGAVLGVSPDSRFVLVSDVPNSLVFLIDTTGTKSATRYSIPGINAVTFAADDSDFWIGGTSGVYTFQADTFVPISSINPPDAGLSTNVNALAWMPDGQSYFASGSQLFNYSTCDNQNPKPLAGTPINLDATAIGGVPHAIGLSLSDKLWYDYAVTTTAQVGDQTVTQLTFPPLVSGGAGDVCLSTVTVNSPTTTASTLQSTASQVTFSPALEQEFVTGVSPTNAIAESVIHGYSLAVPATATVPAVPAAEFTLTAAYPIIPLSGGVLNDGRKLYIGTNDTTNGAVLHRFDLSTGTGTAGTRTEDASTSVAVVPNFVAVVPK